MEKVRYGGTTFELVPGGFDTISGGTDKIIIRHQMGDKTLDEIKAIAKSVTTANSIDLLDSDGAMMRSLDGYVYGGDIREIEDYLVEEREIPIESDTDETTQETDPEAGVSTEPAYTVQQIRADIAVVTFRLPDLRDEVDQIKAVQDEMIVSMLEGGM